MAKADEFFVVSSQDLNSGCLGAETNIQLLRCSRGRVGDTHARFLCRTQPVFGLQPQIG